MAYIYKITSPSNKVYIGSTKDIKTRIRFYKGLRCKQQTKLYNSILKYGWNAHTIEVIEEVDISRMFLEERKWQEFYNSILTGLNCTYVKTELFPAIFSEETRLKMSLSRKGLKKTEIWQERINNSLKGRKTSEETRKKMSMTKLGKKESQATKDKKRLMRIGKTHSPETIEKIRKGQKGKKIFSKIVLQFDLNENFIKEWSNPKEIADTLGISVDYIRDASRGVYNHKAHNYIWKYKK